MKPKVGFIFLVTVYTSTEVCEADEEYRFYDKLISLLDRCPYRDTLIILDDFSASTDLHNDGYELCGDFHSPRTRTDYRSRLLDFVTL